MAVAGSEQIPAAWRAAAAFLRYYDFGEDMPTPLANVSLDDKYTLTSGRIYLSGVQALVRLPAIELNGVGVEPNKKSFTWGRRATVNLDGVARVALPEPPVSITPLARQNIDAVVQHRTQTLTGYQDAVYAQRYESLLPTLSKDNRGLAVEIASLPEEIRGFGHVKDSAVKKTRAKWESLVGQYFARPARVSAA